MDVGPHPLETRCGPVDRADAFGRSTLMGFRHRFDLLLHLRQVERTRRLAGRIVLHRLEELAGHLRDRHDDVRPVEEPVVVGVRVVLGPLERIAAQVEEQRHAQLDERLAPDAEGLAPVLEEDDLPVLIAGGDDLAVVVHVPELLAGRLLHLAAQVVEHGCSRRRSSCRCGR